MKDARNVTITVTTPSGLQARKESGPYTSTVTIAADLEVMGGGETDERSALLAYREFLDILDELAKEAATALGVLGVEVPTTDRLEEATGQGRR